MTAVASPAATGREQAMVAVERQLAVVVQQARTRWRELALQIHPDLQPIGYKILAILVDDGQASAARLVDELATDKSTVSRQVAQLESLGLVERTPDPMDGRVRQLVASPLAVARLTEARRQTLAGLEARLRSWDVADLDALAGLLGRLTGVLPEA